MIKRMMMTIVAVLCTSAVIFAQGFQPTVNWKSTTRQVEDGLWEIVLTGNVSAGWHTYSIKDSISATEIEIESVEGCTFEGDFYEIGTPESEDGNLVYYNTIEIARKVRLEAGSQGVVKGMVTWRSCKGTNCASPEDWDFEVNVGESTAAAPVAVDDSEHSSAISDPEEESSESGKGSIWTLIIEAVLWGFAMLLTPCVFPMVPMTISFFMKGSGSARAGRFKAFMYGLFIVLLYTVPISAIIAITWIVGGDAVTADIFNWLATHWLPNIIFFIVFMVFAASFFGAFEITLPSSLVNKSDQNSDRKGLAGVFFMALTLVLVSFSCTGPIVGSVLIKSTQGEFWAPMVTMLAFSTAFALPFTILAMFPSLLKKMKSGSWLNSVKVVLGFIEIALGLKFLSVADQTYHWGILDRDIYLAIWIVVFTLLGLYLLGKIRFENDSKVEHLTVFRLFLVIVDLTFVVYLIPGMWGAPLKAISGYLPPLETQDFRISSVSEGFTPYTPAVSDNATANKYDLKMPLGLDGYFTLNEGLEAAAKAGKPVFVDITGHGCVNCREMESRVWSDPRVLKKLSEEFVLVALYTDDKTKLDESEWLKADNGKVFKDLGRVNSYIARTRFGVNAQPNYVILSPDGTQLVPTRGYNLDIDGFIAFLQSGIDAMK